MYSGTERFQSFTNRVASSSTKGRAGGRVDVLPPEARPWEQLYHSLREQHRLVLDKLTAAQVELGVAYERAAEDLRDGEERRTAKEIHRLRQEVIHYRSELDNLENAASQAARNGVGFCFIAAARHALVEAQFAELMHTAREMCRGTLLTDELPQPEPDPVWRVPLGKQKRMALMAGEVFADRVGPNPRTVIAERMTGVTIAHKENGVAPVAPMQEGDRAMSTAMVKAKRLEREAAVRALLRNVSPKFVRRRR